MKVQLNQISLIACISKEIAKQGKAQGKKVMVIPFQYNTIIDAVNSIIAVYQQEEKSAEPNMGLDNWLRSHDTGISSKTMAAVLCGYSYDNREWSHPWDNSDLGRCIRFLDAVPGTRERLHLMAEVSPKWKALVEHWPHMETIYHKNPTSLELYNLMSALTK